MQTDRDFSSNDYIGLEIWHNEKAIQPTDNQNFSKFNRSFVSQCYYATEQFEANVISNKLINTYGSAKDNLFRNELK